MGLVTPGFIAAKTGTCSLKLSRFKKCAVSGMSTRLAPTEIQPSDGQRCETFATKRNTVNSLTECQKSM